MTPVQLHGRLDEQGYLDDVYDEGVYALDLAVPNTVEAVQRRRLAVASHPWPDEMAEQFAAAERVVYVGESGNVYDRIMDHGDGKVRTAALVEASDIVDVVGVWPGDRDSVAEHNRARALSDAETVAYANGELF